MFGHYRILFNAFTTFVKRPLLDEVAEWLRRWTANPMGSARVGSNPIFVEIFSSTNSL
jgi:hypothetical protein